MKTGLGEKSKTATDDAIDFLNPAE